ncbi:MAG: hypothetical protein LKKZDAJK_002341 [Candidatus Fervidibacter sp.]
MLNDLSEAAKCFIQFFDVGTASEAASGFGGDSCETDARLTVLVVSIGHGRKGWGEKGKGRVGDK